MRWVVDGYNLIRRDPDLSARESLTLETGRTALLHRLAPVARRLGDEFTVVFDGARREGADPSGGQIRVMFSRPPESADDVVIRLAGQWREGVVIVSSDRTVQTAARRAGATVLSSEQFMSAITVGADAEGEEEDARPSKRGNPRRASPAERAVGRALRRLRGV